LPVDFEYEATFCCAARSAPFSAVLVGLPEQAYF
jgi:hypothetical protein